ncbi:hypothetical protein HMPREF9442_02889 [Paraprevotella xylaniphila YIT 11841]|uniref:Uncharacterized protein n=1 Tax=Paraprevotella xylaniphila YIT 11841 TaxID=762982 RepID=F3QXF3_9BACT|nr:hypothetical protein HMPREF9442_02889 [Paraprevotella xylaniphila YIT 11841]
MPMVRRLLKSVWLTMYQPHRAKCSSVAGTGLQQEIELAVVLETDDVLAAQAACDLAQDAALLLDDRRSGKEGILCDKDSLVHSNDVWSVTNMRNVRHTASGKGGKYAEGRADM